MSADPDRASCTHHRLVRDAVAAIAAGTDTFDLEAALGATRPCWGDAPFAVVDVETTGLDRHRDRVLEIAVVELEADGQPGAAWHTLINPGTGTWSDAVHGITAWAVADAPDFTAVAGELLDRLDGRVLVGHSVAFDLAVLNAELTRAGRAPLGNVTVDTLEVLPVMGVRARRLSDAVEHLGLAATPNHRALPDALAAAAIVEAAYHRARLGGHLLLHPSGACAT